MMNSETLQFGLVCLAFVAFAFFVSFMAIRQEEQEGKCDKTSSDTLI